MTVLRPLWILLFMVAALGGVAESASVPTGFTDAVIASGITWPTTIAVADDGRVFVAEQGGALRVVKNGALLPTPFVSIPVHGQGGAANEAGLVGVTLSPTFATDHFVYVYYTTVSVSGSETHNRVSRFTASANPDVAQAGSERVIFEIPPPSAGAHNSGALHFGTDGKLFVAVGDHSVSGNGQLLTTVKGKILRINPDGSIPSDNPFFTTATGINRAIWAYGFRNPFRTAVQRTTGRLFANDVGNGSWEEINEVLKGGNYGWVLSEGPTTDPRFIAPLFAYPHQSTTVLTGCAIVGGAFYNPTTSRFPSQYVGKYFFADYCKDWLRMLDPVTGAVTLFADGVDAAVDLQVGNDGALYYLQRNLGQLKRITFAGGALPLPVSIADQPDDVNVVVGGTATFTVSAEGTPPFTYQWARAGVPIASATGPTVSFTTTAADDGKTYSVQVSNATGTVTSRAALLSVFNETPPVPTIGALPASYAAGDTITFSGSAKDGQGAALPASALTWHVDLWHDTHTHPVVLALPGAGGTFDIARTEHRESANVFLRLSLTARDAHGVEATVTKDIRPRVATLHLDSEPPGLHVAVDGPSVVTPAAIQSVVGIEHTLTAPAFQSLNGQAYAFVAWGSPGAGASRTFFMPEEDVTDFVQYAVSDGLAFYEDAFVTFGAPWVVVRGAFEAVNGELSNSVEFQKTFQVAILPTFASAAQDVSADFTRVGDKNPRVGLLLRVQDGLNYYLFSRRAGGTSNVQISRVVNGVEMVLATRKLANASKEVPYRLEARADGNVLSLFVDDLFQVSIADGTFTSGAVGIGMGTLAGTSAPAQRADNFRAASTP